MAIICSIFTLITRKRYSCHGRKVRIACVRGVATGMYYTPVGGDIMFVEASVMKGKGELVLTGQLGDVMKESARAALTYARSHAAGLHIREDVFGEHDVHVHVPAGAIPKDGPSAGVSMVTALASRLTSRPVKPRLAMTGEITLRGKVLPVGGIKEKVLAARRAGRDSGAGPSPPAGGPRRRRGGVAGPR